jgi:hypothetical protein
MSMNRIKHPKRPDHALTPEQQTWWNDQVDRAVEKQGLNPCIKAYGPGPAGVVCRDCAHFFAHQRAKKYFKCDLRGFTHGPGTDHKALWPTCGKFEKRT